MKSIIKNFLIMMSLIIIISSVSNSPNDENVDQSEIAKSYLDFAKLTYCDDVATGKCGLCKELKNEGTNILHVEENEKNNIDFRMVISQKDDGELVISFGGPKSENILYFQQIYADGLIKVKEINNILIEKEFWNVYEEFFRDVLHKKIKGLVPNPLHITLIGHSFGGSLAMLTGYDIKFNNITTVNPHLYTFGALKIGSSSFTRIIQAAISIPIIKIRRSFDYFGWMPRCIYVPSSEVWHCYRHYWSLVWRYPMFAPYYLGFSPFIRSSIVSRIPQILSHAPSYLGKPVIGSLSLPEYMSPYKNQQSGNKINSYKTSTNLKKINNIHSKYRLSNFESNFPHRYNPFRNQAFSRNPFYSNIRRSFSFPHNIRNNWRSFPSSNYHSRSPFRIDGFRRRTHFSRLMRPTRISSFIETSKKVSKGLDEDSLGNKCTQYNEYTSCEYEPDKHSTFFGVNLEECE